MRREPSEIVPRYWVHNWGGLLANIPVNNKMNTMQVLSYAYKNLS